MENYKDNRLIDISILNSFVKILNADAVMLYMYINEDDLEVTELLSLIENSSVLNDNFVNNVINNDFFNKLGVKFNELLELYKHGKLSEIASDHVKEQVFVELKKQIKVLRLCSIAEKDPYHSRWSFDYTKRPKKYLVFNNDILSDCNKQIDNEGVTAFFCRASAKNLSSLAYENCDNAGDEKCIKCDICKCFSGDDSNSVKHLFLRRNDIRRLNCHGKYNADPNVYDNFSSHHAAWMILNDVDNTGKSIGCIRFEFYDSDVSGELIGEIEKKLCDISTRSINEIIVSDVNHVLKKNKEFSYQKIYKCINPLLNQIINIGNVKRNDLSTIQEKILSIDKEKEIEKYKTRMNCLNENRELLSIHYHIEHLFYVLKRNTYFGDAIINRINHFIKVLLEKLHLPGGLFSDVWDQLKRHEDLMLYDIDKYRDHLMHQFHTFILGYIIIHNVGIDYFNNLLNLNYVKYVDDETNNQYTKLDVLRIWTLTSLFHDSGYAFEKLSAGLGVFSKRVSGFELKSKFYWDEFIYNDDKIPNILQNICAYFVIPGVNHNKHKCELKRKYSKLTETYILSILTGNAITKNDHGVLSSIILMQQYYKNNNGFSKVKRIVQIMNISCIAIALHNKSVFQEINKKDNIGICLSVNPFVFLLAYCDASSEWGRIKMPNLDYNEAGKKDNYVIPTLSSINIGSDKLFEKEYKLITVTLEYPVEEKGQYLMPEKIDSYLSNILNTFVSSCDISFEIDYKIRGSDKDFTRKRFKNCHYCN